MRSRTSPTLRRSSAWWQAWPRAWNAIRPISRAGRCSLARTTRWAGCPEAQKAFERIGPELHRDPTLLAAYADVLAARDEGAWKAGRSQLVKEALALDPDHPMALSLAATAAYKRHDTAEAARHWQRLLTQLPPDSQEARWIVGTLAEIGAPAATAAGPRSTTSSIETPPAAAAITNAPSSKVVSGTVSLAPALQAQVQPTDTVFVFARATEGSRMPLAVQRARVADLPLRFTLDDSMAMSPQATLSSAREVRIEARVSRQGSATPSAGDLIGASAPMAPGKADVTLTIDRVQP